MEPLELDALVDRIMAEEFEVLRESFLGGAEFAVTRIDSPRERVLHRLECNTLEPFLDRRAQWTDQRRTRLAADPRFRLPLPTLLTREAAQRLTDIRSCKVCWPNVGGRDPLPLRRLTARGLRNSHIGHILSTENRDSLGAIARISTEMRTDLEGRTAESVEVVTTGRTLFYAPAEPVYIWDLPTDGEAIERKMRLFQRLGSGLSPAL